MKEWYPYRFKTEEEFIKEFGEQWFDEVEAIWNSSMDYLFGKYYPHTKNTVEVFKNNLPKFDNWYVSFDMLTKSNQNTPTYEPKQKTNRTL